MIFAPGKYELSSDAKYIINQYASVIKRMKNGRLFLVGQSDAKPLRKKIKESLANNYELSLLRAAAVGDYLSAQHGVTEYSVVGLSNNYTYQNQSSVDLRDDRRVDIYISFGQEIFDYLND